MLTIYKYAIETIDDEVQVKMPVNADVLHVGAQAGLICLWARVSVPCKDCLRTFLIRGTGHPLDHDMRYLGTAHIASFVWHVFEREG